MNPRHLFRTLSSRFYKWFFLFWLVQPAPLRRRFFHTVSNWLPPTHKAFAELVGQLGSEGNSRDPVLDFFQRLLTATDPTHFRRVSLLILSWLYRQHRSKPAQQKWAHSFPAFISLELIDPPTPPQSGPDKQMDHGILNGLMEECRQNGTRYIHLCGTDPLLHTRALTLLHENRKCLFTLQTHGKLLSETVIDDLYTCGNVVPLVNLAGFAKETDLVFGEGRYDENLLAMAGLASKGIAFGVNLVARSDNYLVVTSKGFIEFLIEKGVLFIKYEVFIPRHQHEFPLMLTAQEHEALFRRSLEIRREHVVFAWEPTMEFSHHFGCIAQTGLSLYINTHGHVQPCRHIHHTDARLGEGRSLREIINREGFIKNFRTLPEGPRKGGDSFCYLYDKPSYVMKYAKHYHRKGGPQKSQIEFLQYLEDNKPKYGLQNACCAKAGEKKNSFPTDAYQKCFDFLRQNLFPA